VSGLVVLSYLLRRRRDRPRRVALDTGWEVPDWEAASEGPSGGVQASTGQDSRPELLSAEEGIAVDRKAPER
jgi:hypothetical protein